MSKQVKAARWASVTLLALTLFGTGCGGSAASSIPGGDERAAGTEAVTSTAPTTGPTATPSPEPTIAPSPAATAVPESTVVPERDLPLVEAEQIAFEFAGLVTELFDDPRDMDISRMIQLEAGPDPVQPMTNWTLRAVANLNEENRYQPAEGKRVELLGSQWDPEFPGQLAWVDLCIQTGGVWFNIDTDEPVMNSLVGPYTERYRILTDSMQVAAVAEDEEGGSGLPCEFPSDQP